MKKKIISALFPNKISKYVDTVQVKEYFGERVLMVTPNMMAEEGTRNEGKAIFGADYIIDLVSNGLERGIFSAEELQGIIDANNNKRM
ncbi:hypothetical protein [Marinicella sp. W31]|uniref:hypothetical protein n=1 Tax=Marinicella sp. W31 TaxID=3023713 RepID=UPI00375645C2